MVKTRIGVKYCGGCNPGYERVEVVEEVQSQGGERFLFLYHNQQDLDGLIAVNGCARACAAKDLKPGEIPCRSIASKDDLGSLVQWLLSLKPSGIRASRQEDSSRT